LSAQQEFEKLVEALNNIDVKLALAEWDFK
jgi:hypothetical protein